jgi:hypothetical protein
VVVVGILVVVVGSLCVYGGGGGLFVCVWFSLCVYGLVCVCVCVCVCV